MRVFPILGCEGQTVPYELVKRHEKQVMINHSGQTVERICERGGLDYVELSCVLNDLLFDRNIPLVTAIDCVFKKVSEFNSKQINIGDTVLCTESGVVGEVLSFYIPTSCEEQTMVLTDDGRKYHAPTSYWVKFDGVKKKHSLSKLSMSGINSISIEFVNMDDPKVVILSKDVSQSLVNEIRRALISEVNYDRSY